MLVASYEQVQFVHQNVAALGYFTGLGAYLLRGETIDRRTSVDLALLELSDSRLLCRALGTSARIGHAARVSRARVIKRESESGFADALPDALHDLEAQARTLRTFVAWPAAGTSTGGR